ncbi:Histidinol dehydrogenase [compost metagenome]
MNFSNQYAPEHLIIETDDFEQLIPKIINAGSVFLGHLTPESAGDYASGTNHTLPTSGYARSYSGVSVDSFVKKITFQHISKAGLKNLGPVVEILAELEGLQAHANAVKVRA